MGWAIQMSSCRQPVLILTSCAMKLLKYRSHSFPILGCTRVTREQFTDISLQLRLHGSDTAIWYRTLALRPTVSLKAHYENNFFQTYHLFFGSTRQPSEFCRQELWLLLQVLQTTQRLYIKIQRPQNNQPTNIVFPWPCLGPRTDDALMNKPRQQTYQEAHRTHSQ